METKYQSGSAFFWLLQHMVLSLLCHSKIRNLLRQPSSLSALSLLTLCLNSLKKPDQSLSHCLSQSKTMSQRRNHYLSQSQILSQDQHLIPFQNLRLSLYRFISQNKSRDPYQNLSQNLRKNRPSMLNQKRSLNILSRKVSPLLICAALCKRTHYPQSRCKQPLVSLKAQGSIRESSRNTPCGPGAWDGKEWWGLSCT